MDASKPGFRFSAAGPGARRGKAGCTARETKRRQGKLLPSFTNESVPDRGVIPVGVYRPEA